MLRYLKRTDREPAAQAGAIPYLLRAAPDEPEVIEATKNFLSRPLSNDVRIGALNALGSPSVKNSQLIDAVATSLGHPDPFVRAATVRSLSKMGTIAITQAAPGLKKLVVSPNESPEIKEGAQRALDRIGKQN